MNGAGINVMLVDALLALMILKKVLLRDGL
jgi:hypothetical protein